MRVVLLLAAALAWPVGAAELLATDPAGDPVVTVGGQAVEAARWSALDLLELHLEETPEAFAFVLKVADTDAEGENLLDLDDISLHTFFSYRGADYRTTVHRVGAAPLADTVYWIASLYALDPASQRFVFLREVDLDVDHGASTLQVTVPRAAVVGADGTGALRGSSLEAIRTVAALRSSDTILVNTPAAAVDHPLEGRDQMPDEGAVAWTIQTGIEQAGHARLASVAPVRVSNGEATTFVFGLEASNDGVQQELFALRASGQPASWTVTFPQPRVRIEAGQTLSVPVLVTVPFQHEHGTFASMLVEMQSQHDPGSVGRIELGIRYTAVPQPSGHHDTLYFHTGDDGGAYLNALDVDDADTGEPATSRSSCSCNGWSIARHDVNLLPGLLMGLDFDMDGVGKGEVGIVFDQPVSNVRIAGEFAVYPGDAEPDRPGFFTDENKHAVATVPPVDGLSFEAGEVQMVPIEIHPLAHGDYLPYQQDSWLVLHLDVAVQAYTPFCCLAEPDGRLVPGGSIRLPLEEYHDDVEEYFTSLSGIELYASGPQKRLVNPGRTVVFNATLENVGDAGSFRLELTGNQVDWARLLGAKAIETGAGATRQLAIAVSVPEGARDGEQADITLHAAARNDPNVRSLIRFVAEVDTDEEHPDEGGLADALDGRLAARETPAWPLASLLGIGLMAYATRWRRP